MSDKEHIIFHSASRHAAPFFAPGLRATVKRIPFSDRYCLAGAILSVLPLDEYRRYHAPKSIQDFLHETRHVFLVHAAGRILEGVLALDERAGDGVADAVVQDRSVWGWVQRLVVAIAEHSMVAAATATASHDQGPANVLLLEHDLDLFAAMDRDKRLGEIRGEESKVKFAGIMTPAIYAWIEIVAANLAWSP